jgi:ABC-type glycerol-3-phosphate transport system permease component
MAMVSGTPARRLAGRVGLYAILTFFGLVMVFPFLYLAASSFKAKDDVFRYPPKVLPRENTTVEIEGEPKPLYDIDVDGATQRRALVGTVDYVTYAPPDDLDATVSVPKADVEPTGGFTNQESVVVDGQERDLFDVPVDGDVVAMVEVSRTTRGSFADPQSPDDTALAAIRASRPVETIGGEPGNYGEVLRLQTLDRSLTNTALVTLLVVLGTLLTSILGGYAFARIRFPGRDSLFLIYIGSIMVPFVILIIPLYQLMVAMGWVNSLAALIFPFIFNAYGTFLMRQFFVSIPKELEEAAFVDGASRWTILWRIFVPLSYPAIATLGTFMFLYAWNSFVWPFVVINAGNTDNHVLTLSLQILGGRAADSPNLVFAGVVIAVAVPITIFVLAQRYFVENVATSGIK